MKSILTMILEKKEAKEKNIMKFTEFRKYFFAEEPINVNDYWNAEIDINVWENDFIRNKYIRYFDRKRNFNLNYLGKKTKTIKLKNRGDGKIDIYSAGIYIEYNKKYVIIADKNIVNII